jgi:hypothetical protein
MSSLPCCAALCLGLLASCSVVTHEERYLGQREPADLGGLVLDVEIEGTYGSLPGYEVSCTSPYRLRCEWFRDASLPQDVPAISSRFHIREIDFRWAIEGNPELVFDQGDVFNSRWIESPEFEVDFDRFRLLTIDIEHHIHAPENPLVIRETLVFKRRLQRLSRVIYEIAGA